MVLDEMIYGCNNFISNNDVSNNGISYLCV